ncbi:hypothetical protein ACEPAH_5186 [Sanghuangporus vaninii]
MSLTTSEVLSNAICRSRKISTVTSTSVTAEPTFSDMPFVPSSEKLQPIIPKAIGFFDNRPAMIGVITAVSMIAIASILLVIYLIIRRRRSAGLGCANNNNGNSLSLDEEMDVPPPPYSFMVKMSALTC